ARMSVFIRTGATDEALEDFLAELEGRGDVDSVTYVSADQALEEFRQVSGFGDALNLLESNPLPAVVQVLPVEALVSNQKALDTLVAWIDGQAIVDEVSLDLGWLRKLQALVALGRQAALGLGMALAIGVLL